MSPEEKENMKLMIENAMLTGFKAFAETMDEKRTEDIERHKRDCPAAVQYKSSNSFVNTIKDWKTIAASILALAWILSSVMSSVAGKTIITSEQVKQIVQQIQKLPVDENKP
jgi:hypothetical protein